MTATENERVLLRSRLHWGIFIAPLIVLLGATLPTALVMFVLERMMNQLIAHRGFSTLWLLPLVMIPGGLALVGALISFLKSEVLLTDQRLVFQTGFLYRFSGEIQLRQVETLSIMEPLLRPGVWLWDYDRHRYRRHSFSTELSSKSAELVSALAGRHENRSHCVKTISISAATEG